MGGQRLLWQAGEFSSVQEALQGCSYSVAFTRWPQGLDGVDAFSTVTQMTDHLEREGLLGPSASGGEKVAFVFGREFDK
ncbi:hypothetical protein COCSUDRAFT_55412 [Coccomyxa subellipsoidea C-169]|uniref:Uncharacterized protein n=1 Tax=Coccomyxa subellipsoidea (strain C-169) TaxID=574566 RepID=I0Z9T1_COCSC|nr:hypothetical protein COCSUDRAFT_55412 [Coccomyxa subellipsoidea C-169]EIE27400.1 hypothetical protein COCSUDRAFT_55412 [Coccomyxa subellipsoidea C-169]|eukprot:XP_005651944.1 hypothetical protein COCSUDRAFT_55412 [Coccomyxa subellipsoidea C-169]